MAADAPKQKTIAENRRARFDYFLEDHIEAGLQLRGTEIKALRDGRANIAESYVSPEGREMVLINADIPPYKMANRFNHEPRRHRKLLLHRKQIDRLIGAVQREGRSKELEDTIAELQTKNSLLAADAEAILLRYRDGRLVSILCLKMNDLRLSFFLDR